MLRIFIGYDGRESVAATVLAHSIYKRASCPVSITLLDTNQIPEYARKVDPLASTSFTYSRFLVPWLCNFQGKAVFMDCDMLCLGDVAGFHAYPEEGKAVSVVQHDYQPDNQIKFLGAQQTKYPRKLWSALMVFDCEKCKVLTPDYINQATGAELHRFQWLKDEEIGSIPEAWQWIPNHSPGNPKIVHWTAGGPYFKEYRDEPYSREWYREYFEMSQLDGR